MPPSTDINCNELKQTGVPMTMEESISFIEYSVNKFFHNQFIECEQMVLNHPDRDKCPYLVIGPAYIRSMFAVFTMERDIVEEGMLRVKETLAMCNEHRKSQGITGWFFKPDFNSFTDEEAHMEVLYGEANFMSVVLTFISDPNLLTLIKAVMRLRTAYNTYYRCGQILKEKTNWESEVMRMNFEAGYQMGWSMYNIIMSHLPQRVLKVMSFVGFVADRETGLQLCRKVIENRQTYRHKIVAFLFCFYSFYMEQFFGCGTADLVWVKQITDMELEKFPESAFDLFWSARTQQLHGNAKEAIVLFNKCKAAQDEVLGVHNVCNWDLLWSYAILGDWQNAAACAKQLSEKCNWSKATNLYQFACFQHMIMLEQDRPELLDEIREALKRVPEVRKRIIGRTIPPEKFAITKANAFLSGEEEMILPALELFYIWNIYGSAVRNPELLDPLLHKLETTMSPLKGTNEQYFVLLLLRGVCLRNYGKFEEAIGCFREILEQESSIQKVTYIPPHAAFELGLTLMNVNKYAEAREWLERARDHYTGFLVESLVHLRIHGAMSKLKELSREDGGKKRKSSSNSLDE